VQSIDMLDDSAVSDPDMVKFNQDMQEFIEADPATPGISHLNAFCYLDNYVDRRACCNLASGGKVRECPAMHF
jgi:hypothetical protein